MQCCSSRSLTFRRCIRRNHIKLPNVERAKITSKCREKSKSNNSIWSDRFFDPLGGKIIFFESFSTKGIDWNKNLMVVLSNKVFYGNDVVQRDLYYLETRDKVGNSGGSGDDSSERTDDDEHDEEAYVVNIQKKLAKNWWWCIEVILFTQQREMNRYTYKLYTYWCKWFCLWLLLSSKIWRDC